MADDFSISLDTTSSNTDVLGTDAANSQPSCSLADKFDQALQDASQQQCAKDAGQSADASQAKQAQLHGKTDLEGASQAQQHATETHQNASPTAAQAESLVANRTAQGGEKQGQVNIPGLAHDLNTRAGQPNHDALMADTMQRLSLEDRSKLQTALGMPDTHPTQGQINAETAKTAGNAIVCGTANLITTDIPNGLVNLAKAATFQLKPGDQGPLQNQCSYRNDVAEEAASAPKAVVGTLIAAAPLGGLKSGTQAAKGAANMLDSSASAVTRTNAEAGASSIAAKATEDATKLGEKQPGVQGSKSSDMVEKLSADALTLSPNDPGRALSTGRSSQFGDVNTPQFMNLPGSVKSFPGITRIDKDIFRVSDVDAYMSGVKKAYANAQQTLTPQVEQSIRNYVTSNQQLLTINGIPGLHAEVQTLNHFQTIANARNVELNGAALSIGVVKPGTGVDFPACTNCGNIIPNQVDIVTGRK